MGFPFPLWLHSQPISSLPLLLFIFFFSLLLVIYFTKFQSSAYHTLPPSPPKLPIIGNLHQVGTLLHRSLHSLSQKYGSLMLVHMGQTPIIVVSSADMAKEIMKNHDVVFSNRPISTASKAFVYGDLGIVFAPYGGYWRQLRKISVVDLLSVKRVRSYRFIREEEISNMINKLREVSVKGEPIDLGKLVVNLTNNVISRIVMGRKFEGGELAEMAKEITDLFGGFSVEDMFPSLGWIDKLSGLDRRMKMTSKACLEFLDKVIDEHMARDVFDDDRKDFVDILLDCQKDRSLEIPITKNDIKSLIQDLFVAGTETTYTTLEWAMAELMRHPKVMKKAQEEVREVIGLNKSMVDENEISQMQYLNCVIKETLRLHPPLVFSLPRLSSAPVQIKTYYIPTQILVMVNVWAIGRDPNFWDKPEEFIPERFIDNPIDYKGLDFRYLPFGAGRRVCPGIAFGFTSVESVLANLLYWFDWSLPTDGNTKVDLETEAFGLSVRLKYPLYVVPLSQSSWIS